MDDAAGGGVLGEPGVEVGLGALADGAVPLGEPGEEGGCLDEPGTGGGDGPGAEGTLGSGGPELAQQVPGGEAVQELAVFHVLNGVEPFGQPTFEQQQVPVTVRQHAGMHEQITDVGDRPPGRQSAQAVVGERYFAEGECAQDLLDVRLADPGQRCLGTRH
ncbi:hypothetical protein GCM10010307_72620 [Streptomyces vastus]|uniref:Uncharacterized protein n=1 Tax=Streptomyces vastus TaxID=285451 RepID=A0ABN3RPH5_9ACTN